MRNQKSVSIESIGRNLESGDPPECHVKLIVSGSEEGEGEGEEEEEEEEEKEEEGVSQGGERN